MKKFLSIILCLALLISVLSTVFTVNAAENEEPDTTSDITEEFPDTTLPESIPAEEYFEEVGDDAPALEDKYTQTGTVYDLENEVDVEPEQPETPPELDDSVGEADSDIYGDESFDEENAEQLQGEYAIDEIIVKFIDPEQYPDMADQIQREINKVEKIGVVDTLGVYVIRVEDFEDDPNTVLNDFKNNKYVEYVEPNYVMESGLVPNDPNYASKQRLALEAIGAAEAWTDERYRGSDVPIIAVVDSGVAPHKDMPALLNGYSAVEGLSPNNDKRGHGTAVAGTIGMIGNNATGGTGINWNASIMPVKTDDADGSLKTANLVKGIILAADNGARIINLSCGAVVGSTTLKNAIDYAYNKGCLIVAATGNESRTAIHYPAAYDNVVAVGAASSTTARALYSNYGKGINVVAVGGSYSTTPAGGYAAQSGTSFATPQVSALASLVWSISPDLTNDEVRDFIEKGATTPAGGYNEQLGWGLINIANTLKLVEESKGISTDTPPESSQNTWTAPTINLKGFSEMTLDYGQKYVEAGYTAINCKNADISSSVIVDNTKLDIWTPGIYTVTYSVTDSEGQSARVVRTITVNPKPEVVIPVTAPQIAIKGSNPIILHQTSNTPYTEQSARAVDYDGTDISDRVVISGSINRTVAGTYTITYSVTSPKSGLTATTTRNVRIVAPTERKEPRTRYGITGLAKQGGAVTHNGLVSDEPGFLDLTVSSLTDGTTITVQLINSDTGAVMVSDVFTSAGTKQYMILKGTYKYSTTITKASGIGKYTVELLMPETVYTTFFEDEVPLFLPSPHISPIGSNPIILHIGGTPYFEQGARAVDFTGANLSDRVEIIGKPDTSVAGTYTVTYKVTNDWGEEAETTREVRIYDPSGIVIDDSGNISYEEVPDEIPLDAYTTYTITMGDSLWGIAKKLYGDPLRWFEIYDLNKDVIGKQAHMIYPGQELTVKTK